MNFKGFLKYKVCFFHKEELTEDEFCDKLRTGKQKKLINKVNELGTDISQLNINWDYISSHDKLRTKFIRKFEKYINFDNYSGNPNLSIKKIRLFKDKLNWDILSKSYRFTIDELLEFSKYLNWQYIFFYQNLTVNQIERYFLPQMWWLFSNDKVETENDDIYNKTKNVIIHKNIREIPEDFCEAFKIKLQEYQENKKQLRQILKCELSELINTFNNKGEVNELRKISITINGLEDTKEEEIEENKQLVDGTTQYEQEEINMKEIQTQTEEQNPFGTYNEEDEDDTLNPFEIEEEQEVINVLELYDEPYSDMEEEEQKEEVEEVEEVEEEQKEEVEEEQKEEVEEEQKEEVEEN